MATKLQKIKAASDNISHRFASPKYEFADTEYATSDDNYDLVIEELDYVNKKIAEINGKTDSHKSNKPKKTKNITKKEQERSQWKTAKELKAYFPETLCSEITKKLCELQPTMPDMIIKIGQQMALHISALSKFALNAGLQIVKPNAQSKIAKMVKKSKKQITDSDNMVYIIEQQNKSIAMD